MTTFLKTPTKCISVSGSAYWQATHQRYVFWNNKILKHLHIPFLFVASSKITDWQSRVDNQGIRTCWARRCSRIQGSSHILTSWPKWIFCLFRKDNNYCAVEMLVTHKKKIIYSTYSQRRTQSKIYLLNKKNKLAKKKLESWKTSLLINVILNLLLKWRSALVKIVTFGKLENADNVNMFRQSKKLV